MRLVAPLLIGLLAGHGGALHAQDLRCHPLPLEVEGEILISSEVYLCLPGMSYGEPVSTAVQGAPDGSAEAALKGLVQSIVDDEPEVFRSLSAETELEAIDREFDLYSSALQGVADPVVLERFDLPGLVYFVLEPGDPSFPIAPVLLTAVGDQFLQAMSLLAHPVCQNISAVAQARKANSDGFSPITDPPTTEQIVLPRPFLGASESPLILRFNGNRVSFKIPADEVGQGEGGQSFPVELEGVLRFYESVLAELRSSSKDDAGGYLSLLGARTRAERERFFAEIDESTFERFRSMRTTFREVSYVIDGGDIQIIFYQAFSGDYRPPLAYDIVYKPADGSMKLVNVAIKDSLDHLLGWEEFAGVFADAVINGTVAQ